MFSVRSNEWIEFFKFTALVSSKMIFFIRNVLLLAFFRFDICLNYKPGGISDTLLSGSYLNTGISEQVNYNKDLSGNQGNSRYGKGELSNRERFDRENNARYNKFDKIREGINKDKHISGHTGIWNETDNFFQSRRTGHRKQKYHKIGFSNNYHTDGFGNKASFYDESEDSKEHSSFHKNGGSYETNLLDIFEDDIQDASFSKTNKMENRNYNNDQRYTDTRCYYENYQYNHRYDGGRKYLRDNVGQRYGGNWDYIRPYNYRDYPYTFDNGYPSSNFYCKYQIDAKPKFYSENSYITEYSRNHRYLPDYGNRKISYHDNRYYDDGL